MLLISPALLVVLQWQGDRRDAGQQIMPTMEAVKGHGQCQGSDD